MLPPNVELCTTQGPPQGIHRVGAANATPRVPRWQRRSTVLRANSRETVARCTFCFRPACVSYSICKASSRSAATHLGPI